MIHRGLPNGEVGLDLETLKELDDLGLVDAEFKKAKAATSVSLPQGPVRRSHSANTNGRGRGSATGGNRDGARLANRDLSGRQAVHELFPTVPSHRGVSQQVINVKLGRDEDSPHTGLALRKLEEAGYVVKKFGSAGVEGPLLCEPAPKALELLAGWPTERADALLARLIERLEARIAATPDEEEKGKLRQVLESVRTVGQGMAAVIADTITGG